MGILDHGNPVHKAAKQTVHVLMLLSEAAWELMVVSGETEDRQCSCVNDGRTLKGVSSPYRVSPHLKIVNTLESPGQRLCL